MARGKHAAVLRPIWRARGWLGPFQWSTLRQVRIFHDKRYTALLLMRRDRWFTAFALYACSVFSDVVRAGYVAVFTSFSWCSLYIFVVAMVGVARNLVCLLRSSARYIFLGVYVSRTTRMCMVLQFLRDQRSPADFRRKKTEKPYSQSLSRDAQRTPCIQDRKTRFRVNRLWQNRRGSYGLLIYCLYICDRSWRKHAGSVLSFRGNVVNGRTS